MKKLIISIVFLVTIVLLTFNFIFAQAEEITQIDSLYLWISEKMIRGESYHGLILLDKPATNSQLIILKSANPDIVTISKSITIQPNTNHGIFEINPKSEGDLKITAVSDGRELSATSKIYSNANIPSKLKIILPNEKTKTQSMTALLYSLDENGTPSVVDHNTRVKLGSSDTLKVSRDVMIETGNDHTSFNIEVQGNGFVSASSQGFEPSQVSVSKELENVTVVFEVGPSISHEHSLAYYYVWLEKDEKPFHPPYVVDAFLTSSDEDIASFSALGDANYQGNKVVTVQLVDGFAKGLVHVGNRGHVTLLTNIPEFGVDSTDIIVGKALYNTGLDESPQSVVTNGENIYAKSSRYDKIQDDTSTDLLMWIFPSVTDKNAHAVVGTYRIEQEEEIQISPSDNPDESQQTVLYNQYTISPVLLHDGSIVVSSSGNVIHENTYDLNSNLSLPVPAIEFEITALGDGTHTLYASGTDINPTENTFKVVQQYQEEYRFKMVPLPFEVGLDKDIAIISVIDGTDSIIDTDIVSEDKLEIFFTSAKSSEMTQDIIKLYGNSHVIQVKEITDTDSITVSSDVISPTTLDVIPSGIATSVEILLPTRVHVGELIPYVIHDVDANGIPLAKVDSADFSTNSAISVENSDFLKSTQTTSDGTIAVLSEHGADSQIIFVFENNMSFSADFDNSNSRVGDKVLLKIISDITGIDFRLDSPFPYEKSDDSTFVITPDHEIIDAEILVIGIKAGFTSLTKTVSLDVKNIVTLNIMAASNDGSKIIPQYDLRIGGEIEKFTIPYKHDIAPASILLEFPDEYVTALGTGYKFDGIIMNGEKHHDLPVLELNLYSDTDVMVNYQRQVNIQVVYAVGNGVYEYGETVNVSAPDKEKIWFLVVEKFDRWEGDVTDENSKVSLFSLVATNDVSLTAVYRDDHTNWMVIVMIIVVAVMVFGIRKKNQSVRWIIDEKIGFITKMFVKKSKKDKKKKDSFEGAKPSEEIQSSTMYDDSAEN